MTIHADKHPMAGTTVVLAETAQDPFWSEVVASASFRVEDYWDRVSGGSWMTADGNPAALKYAMRSGSTGLPLDDEVVYGKIGAFGHLVHISELPVEVPE